MEKFISSYKEKRKIFLGDTDSYTIIQNGFTEDDLIFKIKVATLLYDVVFMPAAYMWQSDQMIEVMHKIQPLILTENVLPIIRKSKETRDVKDYFEKRESETKDLKKLDVYKIPSLASEIATSENRKDMLFLHNLNCCLHLEEKSVKEEFINLWYNDLSSNNDINAISMIFAQSNLDVNQCEIMLSMLRDNVDYETFSRSTLIDYILKLDLSTHVKQLIQERVSWLYLKANAEASQSDFYVSRSMENVLVYKANLRMYIKLLRNFGIDEGLIRNLSIEEILRLKAAPEYMNFIENYIKLVENINFEQWDIIEKVNRQIDSMLVKENIKRKFWCKLPMVFGVSSTIFLGLVINYFSGSKINNIAFNMAGGIMTFSGIMQKLESINRSISSSAFADFRDYIIKEKYKEQMQITINGVIL